MNQRKRNLVLSSIALALLSFARVQAATLEDYEHRVLAAASLIEQLQTPHEDESGAEPQMVAVYLNHLRQMLPAKETVEFNGQSINVDNSWLHTALAEHDKASSQTKRADILARIAERLRALDEQLREMQTVKTATEDKDASKGRLAAILRRSEYIQNAPEQSALDSLIERFLRWLSKLFPERKPIQPSSSLLLARIAQFIVLGVCLAAIAFLIWRYGPRFVKGRRQKKPKREARIVLGERLEADQTAADLLAQAEALARSGDLRAAIRKAYIALLCELGDRKLISLAQYKTNRDYLNSVRDKTFLYSAMRKMTNAFELHWYGYVPVHETDWSEFREGYRKALRTGPV